MTKRERAGSGWILGVACAAGILHVLVLAFRVPVFQSLPGWFWRFVDKPLPHGWLVLPLLALALLVARGVLAGPARGRGRLILLVGLGYALQIGFGFMEGRGIDGIRDRLVTTGHAELARVAVEQRSLTDVATHYEELLAEGRLGRYARAKPPGTILFFMVAAETSAQILPSESPEDRHLAFLTFASWVFPLFTYLAVFPLFALARRFGSDRAAMLACLFFVVAPNVTLVTLHLDQVLYPTLFLLPLALLARARVAGSLPIALLAGASAYGAVYTSFSLLPVFPLALLLIGALAWEDRGAPRRLGNTLRALVGFAAGAVVLGIACVLLLHYDPLVRYRDAMLFHETWKLWKPRARTIAYFSFLNNLELAAWVGLALAVAFVAGTMRSLRAAIRRSLSPQDLFALSVLLVFALLDLFGRTKGEVARLWIFLVPLVTLVAGPEIERWTDLRPPRFALYPVVIQILTTFAMKRHQDFW